MLEALEVLHELVDVVAALKGITGNRAAELHAKLGQAAVGPPEESAVPESADGPPGA